MKKDISRDQIKTPGSITGARIMGKILREKGYRLHHHPTSGDHIITSSGEAFSETRMQVRYGMVSEGERTMIRQAYTYLVLCQEKLCKISGLEFSLD